MTELDLIVEERARLLVIGTMPICTIDQNGQLALGHVWIDERIEQAFNQLGDRMKELVFLTRKGESAFYAHIEECDDCSDQLCSIGSSLYHQMRKEQGEVNHVSDIRR